MKVLSLDKIVYLNMMDIQFKDTDYSWIGSSEEPYNWHLEETAIAMKLVQSDNHLNIILSAPNLQELIERLNEEVKPNERLNISFNFEQSLESNEFEYICSVKYVDSLKTTHSYHVRGDLLNSVFKLLYWYIGNKKYW